jgi:hypothetical protein
MLRIVVSTVALVFGASLAGPLTSPASAQSAADLVKQAVAAQGGADALKKLQTISIKGEAKFWEPGQSFKPGGEPRFLGDATYAATADFANRTTRIDWDRDQKYPAPEKMKYTETSPRASATSPTTRAASRCPAFASRRRPARSCAVRRR